MSEKWKLDNSAEVTGLGGKIVGESRQIRSSPVTLIQWQLVKDEKDEIPQLVTYRHANLPIKSFLLLCSSSSTVALK